MIAEGIQIKKIAAVRVAELTATATSLEPAALKPVVQPLCGDLYRRVIEAGLTPDGPATVYYEDTPDGDEVLIHATVPVAGLPVGEHGLAIMTLASPQDEDQWVTEIQQPVSRGRG